MPPRTSSASPRSTSTGPPDPRPNARAGAEARPSCRRESRVIGGEGGIRTHVTVARKPHFECGAFDLSATSPRKVRRRLDARSVDWEGGGYRKLALLPSP